MLSTLQTLDLDEAVLLATRVALGTQAPELTHYIDSILGRDHLPMPQNRGASIHPRYSLNIPQNAVNGILMALEAYEQEHGYNHVVGDRQINLLTGEWRRVCNSGSITA